MKKVRADTCFDGAIRWVLCMALVVLCASCAPDSKKEEVEPQRRDAPASAKSDSLIYEAVLALPEVRKREAYIDSVTKGERKLLVWTSTEPTEEEPFYHIDVGEDNGTSFVAHFHFLVIPGTPPLIRVYDPASNTILTLEEWRAGNVE